MHIPENTVINIYKLTLHMDVMQTLPGVIAGPAFDAVPFQGMTILSGEYGVIYIAKAHYQLLTANAVSNCGYKAIVNVDGGFLEVESTSGPGNPGNNVLHDFSCEIIGLIEQTQGLKTASLTTGKKQQPRQGSQ